MKIWIDIANAPHVLFMHPFIKELEKRHEITITCRDYSNTIDLLDQYGIKYTKIGGHGGKNKIKKLLNFPERIFELYRFLRKKKIDVSFAQSSSYLPMTSWLLGINSIYTNDNEKSSTTVVGARFAKKVFLPEPLKSYCETDDFLKKKLKKITFYSGVKEGIYLSKMFPHQKEVTKKPLKRIYFRPAPWKAHYYSENDRDSLDRFLQDLSRKYEVVLLPRDKEQRIHYSGSQFSLTIPEKPVDLKKVYEDCDLFIGAGGTMTRELAVIGVPTISVYQEEQLLVDQYLCDQGAMLYSKNNTVESVENFYNNYQEKKFDFLEKGKVSFLQLLNYIEKNG